LEEVSEKNRWLSYVLYGNVPLCYGKVPVAMTMNNGGFGMFCLVVWDSLPALQSNVAE
jgi:hypothetical protein